MKLSIWWGVPIAIGLVFGYIVYWYFFAFHEVSAGEFESIVRNARTSSTSTGTLYGGTSEGYHYFIDTWHSYLIDSRVKVRADDLHLPESLVRPYDWHLWTDVSYYFPEWDPFSEIAVPTATK
jgi:hypothetical protein